MKDWPGIDRSTDWTLDGALLANNWDYTIDGELGRRDGMSYFSSQSGLGIINHWHPVSGTLVVYATGTGTIVSLSAT